MSLVDIGANLTHKSFRADLGAVLQRARAAGVDTILVTGTSVQASQSALELATKHGLQCTAGIHPHQASQYGPWALDALRELHASPRVVAVGECGLDYDRDFSPRPAQRAAFAAQLGLASELGKPVFLHERAAHDDFLAMMKESRCRGVVHCFTGDAAALEAYLELGLYIGITGWIADDRRGAHLRPLLTKVPRDRLLIETDAPFLTPAPKKGRNEPAYLVDVLERVARAIDRPVAEVGRDTTAAAVTLFGLDR